MNLSIEFKVKIKVLIAQAKVAPEILNPYDIKFKALWIWTCPIRTDNNLSNTSDL